MDRRRRRIMGREEMREGVERLRSDEREMGQVFFFLKHRSIQLFFMA